MRPAHTDVRRPAAALGSVITLLCAALVTGGPATAATSPETVQLPASGRIVVHWRGNGHGHGMSQYGARGAAIKGLTAAKIVHFYFPHTKLVTVAPSRIRVHISEASADTTVFAGGRGLTLSDYGALPASGYRYFRLTPSGTGLRLQGRTSGKKPAWQTLKRGLPARADFFSQATHRVRLRLVDGTSTRYHGHVGAVREGAGEDTVNRLELDRYVQGSVPREVPSSWEAAAVRAQAIAARSYAEASRVSAHANGALWDICDTTMCQVYGGMAHYDRDGNLLWADDPAAVAKNANQVLRYRGAPVLAQYSASNGGATVSGGEPYLIGKDDPYDSSTSGDPYLKQSRRVSVKALAGYYQLAKVTSIKVTKRDGHGPWGGRIVSAYVNGTTAAGKKAHIATTGFDLGAATGVWTDYLRITVPKK